MRKRYLAVLSATVVLLAGWAAVRWYRRDTSADEVRRIAVAMQWHRGESIGEIGAGGGTMSLFAAEQVGPAGHVYANEIEPARLDTLRTTVSRLGLENITIVEGSETAANLPENCCDAVFMRWVYHHFARPADMNASIFRAVRPGGLLAISDFSPTVIRRAAAFVRRRQKAEGVEREVVIRELTAAGFVRDREVQGWPGEGYCLLFRKPGT